MGRIRYIGSKARVVKQILDIAGPPNGGCFFDVFSGTGVVSQQAAIRGWGVCANDHLLSSSILTTAQLLSCNDVSFASLGGYAATIRKLNNISPRSGFIYAEYTPSGKSRSGHERRYFTTENGRRIDGMRAQIEDWDRSGKLTANERALLLADLFEATNRVANIAGTYGCFLRHWTKAAQRRLLLSPRSLLTKPAGFQVSCKDAFELTAHPNDLAYLDPPYTKRQYAAYYHILETIAAGDSPSVSGVTGLRSWANKSSPFCFKKRALGALSSLTTRLGPKRVLISYSSEGHVALSELKQSLEEHGEVTIHEVADIGRYRPNQKALRLPTVTEYVLEWTQWEVSRINQFQPKTAYELSTPA